MIQLPHVLHLFHPPLFDPFIFLPFLLSYFLCSISPFPYFFSINSFPLPLSSILRFRSRFSRACMFVFLFCLPPFLFSLPLQLMLIMGLKLILTARTKWECTFLLISSTITVSTLESCWFHRALKDQAPFVVPIGLLLQVTEKYRGRNTVDPTSNTRLAHFRRWGQSTGVQLRVKKYHEVRETS